MEVGHRYEADASLVEERRRTLREIEAGDGETARFVKELASRVVDCHLATMHRFDIGYDLLTWESDIIALGFWSRAFDLLRETGSIAHITEGRHAGCWVMPSDGEDADDDDAKVLVKSDGVATYTAKDIADQLWKFVPTSVGGYYDVVNDNAQSEGESWNITGGVGATAPGDTLQTWNYGGTGNTNALFAGGPQYSGYYSFVADNSGLCLGAPSTGSGVQLGQYACNGTPSQAFSLLP